MTQTSSETSTSNSTNNSQEQANRIPSTSYSQILPVGQNAETSVITSAESPEYLPTTIASSSINKPIDTLAVELETGWWRGLSLKDKATISAIAISTLPVFIIGTTSYYFADKLAGVIIGTGVSVVIASAIAIFLTNRAIRPILIAAATVKQMGQGKLDTRIQLETKDELGILGTNINQLADRLQTLLAEKEAAARRDRLIGDIAWRARQGTDPQDLTNRVLAGIRRVLNVDRVVIYRFNPDWSGTVVAESVAPGWTKALDEKIDDPCFRARYIPQYQNGRVRAINDINNEPGLTDCHIRTLEQFEVKANLVAPMRKDNQLVGLLIAHQCAKTRNWQQSEIDFFLQLATQIEYALDHLGFIKQLEEARQSAEAVSLEQRQEKEALQAQIEGFLQQIEGAFQGDLTVRAGVTPGEMGTVADFFNALIENLQDIVVQVQSAASSVTQTAKISEVDVKTLSDEARRQSEAIAATLDQIQVMANSIQKVGTSAQQAALKVQEANQTLKVGDRAMNKTVDGILTIQQTVEETALKVKRLGEASQKISRVSSLIKDLANQTNILALNASIEAAGSGKQGQGFAVVADEVRAIAEQSAAATKEIEQIVEEIQIETNEVVTAMEAGMEQVSTGTNLVKTTRVKLTSIAAVSAQIRTLVEDMAQAATSQMQTSTDLTQTIQEVATIANQTSEQSQTVADSFTKLLGVANELQESVAQFRVK